MLGRAIYACLGGPVMSGWEEPTLDQARLISATTHVQAAYLGTFGCAVSRKLCEMRDCYPAMAR